MLNILIADDHPIFLNGLKEVLEKENDIRVIGEASNGLEALQQLVSGEFSVAILDIDMPRMNGLNVAEEILLSKPSLPVILLTMHKGRDAFLRALEIGILGYVLKENAVIDVLHAIRTVAEGNTYISPEMSEFLSQHKQRAIERKPNNLSLLTGAEMKILQLVSTYRSSRQIAEELFISEKTVSNHRMNIAKKLQLSGKNGLLRFAIENL